MNGCDCHIHILDPAFPASGDARILPGATLANYRGVQPIFGTTRAVVVQSKAYGTDLACLLDALSRQEQGQEWRGIAVVEPSIDDATLACLDAAGVRGVRFSLWNAADAVTRFDMLAPLAPRLAELGWHAQIHMHADQVMAEARMLADLPCNLVFDHMGRLPPGPDAVGHPAFDFITGLSRDGRAWVKLSGPYLNRRSEHDSADWRAVGRAWVAAIPDRLVWGSDWPHVTETGHVPDPADIRSTLTTWCDADPTLEQHILSRNPGNLYGFSWASPHMT
ncbi:MAG: amidohydrolase family protein [Pseudorhodobacter sp.]